MAKADLTIRVQSLDGTWEVLGADKARGITPESPQYTHSTWGSDSASFILKRDTGVPWPDISAFTPVEIWVGGRKVWSGRVSQTPITDSPSARQVAVTCSGWQYHLDDDAYEGKYVHTTLSDWRDIRGLLTADLVNYWPSRLTVQADGGAITLGALNGTAWVTNVGAGVVLDLGPTNTGKRVVLNVKRGTGNPANVNLYIRGHDTADALAATSFENYNVVAVNTLSQSGTIVAGSGGAGHRYISLFAYCTSGYTAGNDDVVTITSAQVFSSTAYESGNTSILKADQVVKDAVSRCCPLLSTDTTQVTAATFSIPEYAPDGYRTPREHITAVNAYENMVPYVDVDQRIVYTTRPTAPVVEVGAWSGGAFEDASTNSAADIYNRVVVEGTGPDGTTLRSERHAGQQTGVKLEAVNSPAPDNPSFATNTASWTGVTRDTGTFDTSPASGLIGAFATETFSGTFTAGVTYVLRLALKGSALSSTLATFGVSGDSAALAIPALSSSFQTFLILWTPRTNITGTTLLVTPSLGGVGATYIDSLAIFKATPTLADRRGFTRTMIQPVQSAMTPAGGNQIGDRFLANHTATPLKGSLSVTSATAVRQVLGGHTVHPAHLGLLTNQMVRLSHRIDFDTGAQTKDGVIVGVSYDHDTETATVQVDNDRQNFPALLNRLAVVTSQAQ